MWITLLYITIMLYEVNGDSGRCCSSMTCNGPRYNWSVRNAFDKYQLREDYVPVPPEDLIELRFGEHQCRLGNIINPWKTFVGPTRVSYPDGDESDMYTFMFLDIDDPSREISTNRARISVIIMNSSNKNLTSGDTVIPYQPLSPPVGTGMHRFVALVYKQDDHIDVDQPDIVRLAQTNVGFSAVNFAMKYDLGDPVAGSFCLAEFTTCGIKHGQ